MSRLVKHWNSTENPDVQPEKAFKHWAKVDYALVNDLNILLGNQWSGVGSNALLKLRMF